MANIYRSDNFENEVMNAEGVVMIDFYADWCGPCKMLGPIVDKLAEEYAGRVKIGKVNVDESEDIAAKFGVMSIPTIIFFKNGEVKERFQGVQDQKALISALEKNF